MSPKTQPVDEFTKRVAENIRIFRVTRRLSLRSLAEKTGISAPMLSRIENAKRSPTLDQFRKIADELNVEFATLIEGIDHD